MDKKRVVFLSAMVLPITWTERKMTR